MESKLMPCPWCDVPATVMVCDEEGNIHDDGYEDDPWSGLRFALRHDEDSAGKDCLIATESGVIFGYWIYETREEAENAWNRRRAPMTTRPIDKSKKSNWRCASCGNWTEKKFEAGVCLISGKPKHYYNRCKADFVWREDKTYVDDHK